MRKLLLAVGAAALLATPAASKAQLQLGVRLGYGFGSGEAKAGTDQADNVGSQVPFQVDLGYKLTKKLAVGGYFSYALGFVSGDLSDLCDAAGEDCSASGVRAGVQLVYDFSPGASFDPWVGLGAGYEWVSISGDLSPLSKDPSAAGWEFASLQAGADFEMSKGFGLGPFVSWSFGQYGSSDDGMGGGSQDIEDKGTHQLVQIGVRGLFSF